MKINEGAVAARNTDLSRDMLRHAHLVSDDPTEQAIALVTAAAVLIERQVGPAMAEAALNALIEPTMTCWRTHAGRDQSTGR